MAEWLVIQNEWKTSNIKLAALAEKHELKLGTLKSRKSREGWSSGSPKKDATKKEKDATLKEVVVESEGLTDKQRLFFVYYIKSFNQTMAAIKAGYAPDSAHVEGHRLLRNAKVADEVKRLKGKMCQGIFIDAMDVLDKYIRIAFADITDFVSFRKVTEPVIDPVTEKEKKYKNGKPKMTVYNQVGFKDSSLVDGSIITEVKQGRGGISVKLADKMKALDMLSKYFDLLSENDNKKLQDEKLKVDITKANAELDKLNNHEDDDAQKDVAAALRVLVDGLNAEAD